MESGDGTLCDTLEGCICPHCGAELKVQDSRRRTQKGVRYFCILTTCRGYQVIRVAQAHYSSKKGEPMKFYCTEVVQRWISPDGKVTDMALLRTFPSYYCDQWSLYSDMEVRPYNSLYDDVCKWSEVYPLIRTIHSSDAMGSRAISTASHPCCFSRECFPIHGLKRF